MQHTKTPFLGKQNCVRRTIYPVQKRKKNHRVKVPSTCDKSQPCVCTFTWRISSAFRWRLPYYRRWPLTPLLRVTIPFFCRRQLGRPAWTSVFGPGLCASAPWWPQIFAWSCLHECPGRAAKVLRSFPGHRLAAFLLASQANKCQSCAWQIFSRRWLD